ncbi:MAG: RNA polymerase sigma factor [Ruminococcaceae bacterium]|nr:RNA polymerase sigma factor [Oscillospiraceae bacterium]
MVEALYAQYRVELVRWCETMTDDRQSAEDLVQEAFLHALSNVALLEVLDAPQRRAWLYRTVKNLFVDRVRHGRFETLTDAPPEEARESEDYAAIEWRELLDSLEPEERELFTLRYLGGYNASQLGERFALPAGTVRARLSRTRGILKTKLKEGAQYDA